MKVLFALLVACLGAMVWLSCAKANIYPGVESPQLEAKLPTAVSVFCTSNTSYSFALIADQQIYLGADECATLTGSPSNMAFFRAAEVLYHEWWHVAFRETNEKQTECGAYSMLRYALRHYWHMTRKQAQEQYRDAWQWSPYAPLPCAPDTVDPVQV